MKKNNKKGFTIVELVIVIAVIAILAAVLIPTFSSVIEKANQSADEQTCVNYNKIVAMEVATNEDITLQEAMIAFEANGYNTSNFQTKSKAYTYAFDATNKKVVIVENGAIIFPKDAKTGGELWTVLQGRELTKGIQNYLLTSSLILNNTLVNNGVDNAVIDLNNFVASMPEGFVEKDITLKNGVYYGAKDTNVTLDNSIKSEGDEGVNVYNKATVNIAECGAVQNNVLTIDGEYFTSTATAGSTVQVIAEGYDKVIIKNSTFANVKLSTPKGNVEIENCTFYNYKHFAVEIQDDSSNLQVGERKFTYTIKNNQFINVGRGINLFLPRAAAATVEGNTFALDMAQTAIAIQIGAPQQNKKLDSADAIEFKALTIKNNTVTEAKAFVRLHEYLYTDNDTANGVKVAPDYKTVVDNCVTFVNNNVAGAQEFIIIDAQGNTALDAYLNEIKNALLAE